ncbi:hypothetical protein ES703_93935 [subsurface metagenome]
MGYTTSYDPYDKLTNREKGVLRLVAKGRKSSEIAELLGITIETVLGHRTNMLKNLTIKC